MSALFWTKRPALAGILFLFALAMGIFALAELNPLGSRLGEAVLRKIPLTEIPCDQKAALDCYSDFYEETTERFGSEYALSDITTRYESDPLAHDQCHLFTHIIGRVSARALGDVSTAFARGSSFCWSGYYHGVMEYLVSSIGKTNIISKLWEVCAPIASRRAYTMDHYNCVHGLGHGVMAITYNEVPEALRLCDTLEETAGNFARRNCWTGVFMENIIAEAQGEETPYLRPGDFLYPCTAVESAYRDICYSIQTSYMLKVADQDFQKVFGICRTLADAYKNMCFRGLGSNASGFTVSEIEPTNALCALGADTRERSNCLYGAARDFFAYYRSGAKARRLCEAAPSESQTMCFKAVEEYRVFFLR